MRPRRQLWVVAHRWAGLTIALFLVVVGATGALLPWQKELTFLARPDLSRAAPPFAGVRRLDPVTLAMRVERVTGGRVGFVDFDQPAGRVASIGVAARGAAPLPFDTVWADPYTGRVRLVFQDGVLADGPQTIMSFLYRVHRELALGRFGRLVLGVAALIWTLDCFVGFYLTLPVRRRARGGRPIAVGKSWWARWRPAWLVRWTRRAPKLTFDLHRAGGLWLWPLLLVFAWSGVGLDLAEVHDPVMRLVGGTSYVPLSARPTPLADPPIGFAAAARRGDALLRAIRARRGFAVERPMWIYYDPSAAAYRYMARSSLDVVSEGGRTEVAFSAVDGRLLRFAPPLLANRADAFTAWLDMLHFGEVGGVAYRVLVSLVGLLVVGLSVTGVLIYARKRSARLLAGRAGVRRERGAAQRRRELAAT